MLIVSVLNHSWQCLTILGNIRHNFISPLGKLPLIIPHGTKWPTIPLFPTGIGRNGSSRAEVRPSSPLGTVKICGFEWSVTFIGEFLRIDGVPVAIFVFLHKIIWWLWRESVKCNWLSIHMIKLINSKNIDPVFLPPPPSERKNRQVRVKRSHITIIFSRNQTKTSRYKIWQHYQSMRPVRKLCIGNESQQPIFQRDVPIKNSKINTNSQRSQRRDHNILATLTQKHALPSNPPYPCMFPYWTWSML